MKSNEKIILQELFGKKIPVKVRKEGNVEVIDDPESVQRIKDVFEEESRRKEALYKGLTLSVLLLGVGVCIWYLQTLL